MMRTVFSLFAATQIISAQVEDFRFHSFQKIQLTDRFWSEGANAGDFNQDGKMDIVAGPYWWEGPDFTKRHTYYPDTRSFKLEQPDGSVKIIPGYPGELSGKNGYSENFLAFVYDFNRDEWDDILIMGFPGRESYWYENPRGAEGYWPAHVAIEVTDNESPHFVDLTGDGLPEIVCNSGGYFGFASPDWEAPTKVWKFRPVTPKGKWFRFTHGMGVGDVNGDGRQDIMEKDGWWEQPPTLVGDPVWQFHPHPFSPGGGGAQMYAYDVDGDGDNDVITSLAAHGYGLAWYENIPHEDRIEFKAHVFMNKEPEENRYGVKFSQMHAVELFDIDRDGLKDIVTGKRFWAHGPNADAEPNAPAVLYWFKLRRHQDSVDFIPFLIDDNSGIGTQVLAKDIDNDDFPEIIVGNKKGVFVHRHKVKTMSRKQWDAARPQPQR